jgi:hypothetical protein
MTHARCRDDRGQVGGIEILPFGFLVFVAGMLLMANAWGVVDSKLAVTTAAREAVRAFVESPDAQTATSEAGAAAAAALDAYGRDGARAQIGPPVLSGEFGRCARVTITVSYEVPVLAVPFIGGFGDLQPVSSTFTELVDPYRNGLEGPAAC